MLQLSVLAQSLATLNRRIAWPALLAALLACPTIAAARTPTSSSLTPKLRFLAADAIAVTTIIVPPPLAGTPLDRLDNGVLHLEQSSRSPEDCSRAAAEVVHGLGNFFGPGHGPLTTAEVERLDPLFSQLVGEVKYFSNQGKKLWRRPRPYDKDTTLVPCVDKEATFAYPSGHAAVSRAFAQILSKLFPERSQALLAAADHVALNRVIGGLHHPSDVLAGQQIGLAVATALLQNAKFNAALDALATKAP